MSEKKTVHEVLLHSNDLHADFHSKEKDEKLVGGISRLSGYLKKMRAEYGEENVHYAIAGDMFRGDVIDAEYLGLSTIRIINYLKPEVCCVGNHEIDYGIAHSLILEKLAEFPVINANVYFKGTDTHFYTPYVIMGKGRGKILVIGVITKGLTKQLLMDENIGAFLEVRDPAEEIKKIVNELGAENFTGVTVLSHIGFEEDVKLAEELEPELGVSVIIGGHSHTLLEKPEIVNDIAVVQAGIGTEHIGRFDYEYDPETLELLDWSWQCVEINNEVCDEDPDCADFVERVKASVDDVYSGTLCTLSGEATHPVRNEATTMSMLYADLLASVYGLDAAITNGASVRGKQMGPVVTKGDFKQSYPYMEEFYACETTLGGLRKMLAAFYGEKSGSLNDTDTSILICSDRINYVWNDQTKELESFQFDGKEANDDMKIRLGLIPFLVKSKADLLEVMECTKPRVISTDQWEDIQDYMEKITETIELPSTDRVRIKL